MYCDYFGLCGDEFEYGIVPELGFEWPFIFGRPFNVNILIVGGSDRAATYQDRKTTMV